MNDDNFLSSSTETNGFHLTMPLFELFGDSSSQEKPTDLSFIPESDFAELIWENGQLMMQGGQSSRGRKPPSFPSYYNSTSQNPTKHTRDAQLVATNNSDGNRISSSSDRLTTYRSGLNDLPPEIRDDGDDDTVPWFNCPINDFFPELSGITENFDSMKNNKEPNFHPSANDGVTQVPIPSHGVKGSEASGSGMTSTSNAARGDSSRFPSSSNFVNFSHFSRPKSVNRSTGWNNSVIPDPGPSDMERVVFSSKQDGPSAEVKHTNGSKSVEANRTEQPPCSKNAEGVRPEDTLKFNGTRDENAGAGTSRDPQDAVEPVVASSVCSGNGLDIASDDPTCNLKRKSRDTYDSEAPSDDVEEDSVGLRKAGTARGNSSKRGRAAEVHNLSERRRRDRINEKMRALQELIPNCNKVDKASMLDEAIEYLKTLQIQVQIMSMGSGMYMPPMMFQGGMHPAHMAQIQAMGVGMASGLGFRMGMVEPNSGIPMMQIPPPMQATHFPSPYMSGHPAMHGAVGPGYPVMGVPGHMSIQRPPMIPFAGTPVQRPSSGIPSSGSMDGAVAATTIGPKEPMPIADGAVGCLTNPTQTDSGAS